MDRDSYSIVCEMNDYRWVGINKYNYLLQKLFVLLEDVDIVDILLRFIGYKCRYSMMDVFTIEWNYFRYHHCKNSKEYIRYYKNNLIDLTSSDLFYGYHIGFIKYDHMMNYIRYQDKYIILNYIDEYLCKKEIRRDLYVIHHRPEYKESFFFALRSYHGVRLLDRSSYYSTQLEKLGNIYTLYHFNQTRKLLFEYSDFIPRTYLINRKIIELLICI